MALRIDLPEPANVTGLRCVRVWVPDSDGYESALHSLLTYANRWFAWQRDPLKQGTIAAALWRAAYQQTIADYFSGKNCDCDNGGDGPSPPVVETITRYIFAENGDEGEDSMGWLCGTNPAIYKIEDGVLYVKNFCGDWVAIGALTSPTEVPPDNVWEDVDPAPDFYGCGKITSLITYMVALSYALWDSFADPQTIEAAARAAVPPATLSRTRIYQWIATLISLDTLGMNASNFTNAFAIQAAKCYAVAYAEDTGTGTVAEKEAVEEGMATSFYNIVGIMTKTQWKAYWHAIQETIGDQDCLMLLSLGATDDTEDCDCPSTVQASDIYFDGTFDLGTSSNFEIQTIESVDGGRRVLVTGQVVSSGSWREANDAWAGLAGGGAGDSITFRVYPSVAGNPVPCENWTLYDPPRPSDEWYEMELPDEQGHYTLTHVDEAGYREYVFTMNDAGGSRAGRLQTYNMRIAPQDAAVGGEYRIWYIEIVKTVVSGLTKEYIPIGP